MIGLWIGLWMLLPALAWRLTLDAWMQGRWIW